MQASCEAPQQGSGLLGKLKGPEAWAASRLSLGSRAVHLGSGQAQSEFLEDVVADRLVLGAEVAPPGLWPLLSPVSFC